MTANSVKSFYLITTMQIDMLKKVMQVRSKIKGRIRSTYNNSDDYDEKHMKIKLIQMMICLGKNIRMTNDKTMTTTNTIHKFS